MSNDLPILWERLAWPEVPEVLETAGHTVLLPCGATEQHGPHLGTGVDTTIAWSVCERVSALTRVPLLPPLSYGCSLGHSMRWPGTLSLSPQTLISVVSDIGDWLVASGVRRLLLVNAHMTNFAPLRCALEALRARHDRLMVGLIATSEISPRVREVFFAEGDDWHANGAETSLMLSLRPSLARPELFGSADDPDRTAGLQFAHPVNRTSTNGVTGYPSRASEADGRKLFEMMVEDLSAGVRAAMTEEPPLPHPWKPAL
jgi:creatinine amidohydrolase